MQFPPQNSVVLDIRIVVALFYATSMYQVALVLRSMSDINSSAAVLMIFAM